jgi:Rieske Fe-S protein
MSPANPNRRGFLNQLTSLVMALLALLVAIPALGYVLAPLRRRRQDGDDFVDVGPLSAFPEGQWRLHALEMVQADGWKSTRVRRAIWVRRQGPDARDVTVLSSICPHLGCPVNWHPDQGEFACPCHGAAFDADGRTRAGPPPRGMDRLAFEVRAGHLWVHWQDFKIGVRESIPVSV